MQEGVETSLVAQPQPVRPPGLNVKLTLYMRGSKANDLEENYMYIYELKQNWNLYRGGTGFKQILSLDIHVL